ncbi:MAG: alpha/beta fold hydrolase [Pseudomonadota bacterium]
MTPLVLLPGMMCDARLWGPQIAALSGAMPLHMAPLVGQSSVPALAAQVLDTAPPRFALAGLSMGGIVAMEIVAQAPQRVSRLALLDTNPLAEAAEMRARRAPQIAAALAGHLEDVMRDEMKPRYLAAGSAEILDLCLDMALSLGPRVFEQQSIALRDRPDQSEVLRAVTVPTLLLCGAEDSLCPPARHELMRDLIPGAELVVIPEAGHLPVLERPDVTTRALQTWLTR